MQSPADRTLAPERYLPGLFWWAAATAACVWPLVSLGGLVTSLRAGMVDPQSVREPWHMVTWLWQETGQDWGWGYLVEHGHRQLGWIVGVMALVLAGGTLAACRSLAGKLAGVLAALAVAFQGVLGILRVELNRAGWGLELAMVHGVTGQLVFAYLAVVAVTMSRGWIEATPVPADGGQRFRKMAWLTFGLLLGQLLVGVWIRQQGSGPWSWVLWLHLVLALAVLAHAAMLVVRARRPGLRSVPGLAGPSLALLLLVVCQGLTGALAWWVGAGQGALDHRPVTAERAVLTTLHVGLGALVLASSAILLACAGRVLHREPSSGLLLAAERGAS
jgi:cytochrome c oxidase assembly protein subunit 15